MLSIALIIIPVNVADTMVMVEEAMMIEEDTAIMIEETAIMETIDMTIVEVEVGAGDMVEAVDGAMMTVGETIMENKIVHLGNQLH